MCRQLQTLHGVLLFKETCTVPVSMHLQSTLALQVIRVLHNKTLAKAAHDIKRLKILSDISQFDAQILKLTTYVFLWIHWNACLQYGSCVAQPDSR